MLDTFLWSRKFPLIRELEIVAGVRSGEIADTSSGCGDVTSCRLNGDSPREFSRLSDLRFMQNRSRKIAFVTFVQACSRFAQQAVERFTLAQAVAPLNPVFWNQRLSGWFSPGL